MRETLSTHTSLLSTLKIIIMTHLVNVNGEIKRMNTKEFCRYAITHLPKCGYWEMINAGLNCAPGDTESLYELDRCIRIIKEKLGDKIYC